MPSSSAISQKRAARAGWDAMSASYQADSDISLDDIHYAPFAPGERHYNLLGEVAGLRVLELACGGAQNAIALTKRGANATAMDFSPNQLRHALANRQRTRTRFDLIAGDMERPRMFRDESFDIILSCFGWEFIPDLRGCVDDCARILRPNGRILICTVHPLTAFDWLGARGLLVTDYFNPPIEVWDDPVPDGHAPALTFFRTIEETVAALTDAGLAVERLVEPCPVDGVESPYAGRYWADHRARLERIPFAVVLVGRKGSVRRERSER